MNALAHEDIREAVRSLVHLAQCVSLTGCSQEEREILASRSWRAIKQADALAAERDQALAELAETRQALRGWEARDHDGEPPHNIERGTLKGGNLEVLVEGLTGKQADRIEDFIARLEAVVSASPNGNE